MVTVKGFLSIEADVQPGFLVPVTHLPGSVDW